MLSRVRCRPRGRQLGWRRPISRPSFQRNFSETHSPQQELWSQYPVRILGPTVWSLVAIGTIYFACAAFDVYRDVQKCHEAPTQMLTFEVLESYRASARLRDSRVGHESSGPRRDPGTMASPVDDLAAVTSWDTWSGPGKAMASVAGVNALTLGLSFVPAEFTKRFVASLAHIPAEGAFRYRQLVTSTYVHTGPLHFAINMYVMFRFASPLAQSSTFIKDSGSHTLAFYTSAGIASALGHHISTNFWPNKMGRFSQGLGFSGVTSAIFAAWCMEYPDTRLQLIFLPGEFSAREALSGVSTFEALGALGLLRFLSLNVAYTAHLSGLLFGAAYIGYGQREKAWTPFRRAAFRSLKFAGAI